ncbi:GTP-binding protein [Crossiella sp. CA-258035]|uniref:ribosome hibernation factor-recruiting GTPase MRF n=1 Tax=Crossiella sp. CA-258035 TaxID=2981138 RepID=UPI0024BCCB18|nr:GTP-binding protein [Crossiella sp. CA-258035]WHT20107.1 GTP-binding protein [Crossiella sp. CA-258035]
MTPPRTSLVLVAGLAAEHATAVADRFAADPGTVVLHHDLREVTHGVVVRRLRHGALDATETLELAHGCVSCTLREDLLPLVLRLTQAPDVRRIVLHCDRALEPEAVCWALQHVVIDGRTVDEVVYLDAVLTVVDAETWFADATGDLELSERGLGASADDERTIAQVAVSQVEFADLLVLAGSAPDAWTAARTDAVLDRLAPLAPRIRLGDLDPVRCLDLVPGNARRGEIDDAHAPLLRGQPPLSAESGVQVTVFSQRRPFHPDRLHEALDFLLDGVVRARGRVWVASQPDVALWLETAGGGLRIGHAGPWLAAIEDWSGIDPDRRAMADLIWDPYYGDRSQDLFVLSHTAVPGEIVEALESALLTDEELAEGQEAWLAYEDPFGSWHEDPCDDDRAPTDVIISNQKDEA